MDEQEGKILVGPFNSQENIVLSGGEWSTAFQLYYQEIPLVLTSYYGPFNVIALSIYIHSNIMDEKLYVSKFPETTIEPTDIHFNTSYLFIIISIEYANIELVELQFLVKIMH